MKRTVILTLAMILAVSLTSWAGTVIVIGNKDVPVSSLSQDEVQRIFLGKKTSWDNGKKIVPVVLRAGHVHGAFLKSYLGRNDSQFDTYWKEAVFTGKGKPPKSMAAESDVVQFVSSTSGAVGYIDSDTPHPDVKSIDVR